MSTSATSARRVVLTGRGLIADAVQRALRSGDVVVEALGRGDNLTSAVAGGDTVIVLDGARPAGGAADYAAALHAISSATEAAKIGRVVTVTLVPPSQKLRRAFLETATEAEARLRSYGIPLTVVRCGLVIGTPDLRGPADRALLARRKVLVLPGDGSQQVAPMNVAEVSELVVEVALRDSPRNEEIIAERPAAAHLREFARELNGDDVRLWQLPRTLFGFIAVIGLGLGAVGPAAVGAITVSPAWPAAALVVGYGTALWGFRTYNRLGILPERDFLLRDAEDDGAPPPQLPRSLREQRRARIRSQKSARRYGAAPGAKLTLAVLVLVGVTSLVVGAWDFIAEPTLGGKVTNAFLLLAGATICAGAFALTRVAWAPRYAVAFLAAVVATATVATIELSALRSPDAPAGTQLALGYLLMFCVLTCIQLWRRGALALASFVGTRGIAWFSSLIVGGTIIGAAQFFYSNVYAPSIARPGVSISATARALGSSPDGKYLVFRIDLHNFTSSQIYLLGGLFQVSGETAVQQAPTSLSYRQVVPATDSSGQTALSYSMRITATRVLEDGTLAQLGDFLAPGESQTREIVVSVPRRFQLARLTVTAATIRLDGRHALARVDPSAPPNPGLPLETQDARLADPSLLHKLTEHPRYVHFTWLRTEDPGSQAVALCPVQALTVAVDDSPHLDGDGCDVSDPITDWYDIVRTTTEIESAANIPAR